MSDRDDPEIRNVDRDRVEALASAAMDDQLDAAGREELQSLVDGDQALAARVRALHRVDASLRTLASASASEVDDRLAENFEALKARIRGEAGSAKTRLDPPRLSRVRKARVRKARVRNARVRKAPVRHARVRIARVWIAPIVLAAAAALVVYLLVPVSGPAVPAKGVIGEGTPLVAGIFEKESEKESEAEQLEMDRDLEEELAWALGYVDDPASTNLAPGIPVDDLEFIEQLEVLEYLAARDSEGRG